MHHASDLLSDGVTCYTFLCFSRWSAKICFISLGFKTRAGVTHIGYQMHEWLSAGRVYDFHYIYYILNHSYDWMVHASVCCNGGQQKRKTVFWLENDQWNKCKNVLVPHSSRCYGISLISYSQLQWTWSFMEVQGTKKLSLN